MLIKRPPAGPSARLQSIKSVPDRRGNDHLILAADDARGRISHIGPIKGAVNYGALLQGKTCGWRRPGEHDGICRGSHHSQCRCAWGLHGGDNGPKTSIQREVAATHVPSVSLANRSGHRKNSACARAAAAIDCEPINRIILRLDRCAAQPKPAYYEKSLF